MKKTILTLLLITGMGIAQDTAKPVAPPPPTVEQLQAENAALKAKILLLQQKIALIGALEYTNAQIDQADKPKASK